MKTPRIRQAVIVVGLVMILSACSDSNTDDSVVTQIPDTGAAIPETVDTETLVVDENFSFDTARVIDIEFDIADARAEEASVSICTEYTSTGEDYDINYDSCPVKGILDSGVFNHSMEVTNAYDAVVAVVWFQDSELAPIYQEFQVATHTRSKRDRLKLVWIQ